MASEIHLNDIGTKFVITVKDGGETVDISNPNIASRSIIFRKPSDVVVTKVGAVDSAGTFYTDINTFQVHSNL